jgi:F-type H+-transporting ATPase subunit 8
MPQLIPFFFINQVTYVFLLILLVLYILSKYILPGFAWLFSTRLYITKI